MYVYFSSETDFWTKSVFLFEPNIFYIHALYPRQVIGSIPTRGYKIFNIYIRSGVEANRDVEFCHSLRNASTIKRKMENSVVTRFMPYPALTKVDRGDLVLRHSIPHFASNSGGANIYIVTRHPARRQLSGTLSPNGRGGEGLGGKGVTRAYNVKFGREIVLVGVSSTVNRIRNIAIESE